MYVVLARDLSVSHMITVFTRMSGPARRSASLEWAPPPPPPPFDGKYLMSASLEWAPHIFSKGALIRKKSARKGRSFGNYTIKLK